MADTTTLELVSGWVVEASPRCTCGQPYGCEPSCGLEPIMPAWEWATFVVPSPATPDGQGADLFVADRHRLAGYLDACLDGLGYTDVHSATWLADFEADHAAPASLPGEGDRAPDPLTSRHPRA